MKYNTNYLRFDALSIKKLIEQKLSEDTNFTDFIYPGSDLSIVVDLISNAFQVLQYYVNQAGSESIATGTQFYENINRIVKFLDYHPNGYITPVVEGIVSGVPTSADNQILPPYTRVDTGLKDTKGDPVYYSTTDFYYLYDDNNVDAGIGDNDITLYNGRWRMYEIPLVSEGIPYETFTLESLYSDSERESYIAYPYIHAFVKRVVDDVETWKIFKPATNSLFINREEERVYDSDEKVFELRLNEYKQIELKFGDGIYAQQLEEGDVLYIAYLKSNGSDGRIDANVIDNSTLTTQIAGFNTTTLEDILADEYGNLINDDDFNINTNIKVNNISSSSDAVKEETVDQIKQYAPHDFKAGGRLLTADDFEYYIKSKYYKDVIDVKAQNNWTYLKTFMAWLYNAGIRYNNDSSTYLSNSLKSRYGYEYTDSCDFNNVYLWMQMKAGFNIPRTEILKNVQSVKTLTSEVVLLDPIQVNFVPCAYDNGYSISDWDSAYNNYLEIELVNNTTESPAKIRGHINQIILDYFAGKNQTLGSIIDFNQIQTDILSLNGVNRIRTVYKNGTNEVIVDGLKFMKWSATILEGADKELVNGSFKLHDFMFPNSLETSLINRIKVITESAYQTNEVEY